MAHNLNYNAANNEYSFFSVKERAWHGLGKIVEQYPTSAEAIKFAGLDYTVEKRPLFTFDTENHTGDPDTDILIPEIEVPNYFANVRTDNEKVLGVVGKDYQIVATVSLIPLGPSIPTDLVRNVIQLCSQDKYKWIFSSAPTT